MPAGIPLDHFHRWGCDGKRLLHGISIDCNKEGVRLCQREFSRPLGRRESILTLSVKSFGFASSPERGSFWRIRKACTLSGNCAVTAKKLPPRGSWRTNVSLRGFGAPKANGKPFPQRHTFEESGAANAVSLYDPLREKSN